MGSHALKHKRERQTTRSSEKKHIPPWVQILFRKFFDKMGGEEGVGLVVCLIMQWAGNAGNECSLSGGLNGYRSIDLTDKIRNRNAEYYLQVWEFI